MKLRRVIKAFSWLLGIALYVTIMGFAAQKNDETVVTEVDITIVQPENQYFLTKEIVRKGIDNQLDSLEGEDIDLINTALLEESLENHPVINNAEVYFTLDGKLNVHVEQYEAIARVRANGEDLYMNQFGEPFPRSNNHSANVPMITGHIDSSHWQEAYAFLQLLDDSSWLQNNIEALQRDSSGEYTVYPKMGRHKIYWGKLESTDQKIKKLEVFYTYLTEEQTMDSVKTINVQFRDQIVSTKY